MRLGNRIAFFSCILVLGVVARVAMLPRDSTPRLGSDDDEYDAYAWNLAKGDGYRGPSPVYHDRDHLTSWRMPAPSLMFAVVYKFVGHRPVVAVYMNILVSAATCIPLFYIGLALYGEIAGRISSAVYSLWPHAIFLSTHLLSEPLYVFLLTVFVVHSFILAEARMPETLRSAGFCSVRSYTHVRMCSFCHSFSYGSCSYFGPDGERCLPARRSSLLLH